ncbi:hypothetical protein BJ944DRAFT_163307 [Cunninghamella echinulata]|nr:hypothetical protein BJ944DRAFT_163307 [Cunninghamella echinulata]
MSTNSETEMNKTALVLGATGAVGKALLKNVLKDSNYTTVIAMGRRAVELDDSIPKEKLVQKTVNFGNLEENRQDFRNIKADAGSAENFLKIDQEYVVNSAKMIVEENPSKNNESTTKSPVHFLYCSSTGANKNSWFLYPRSKGETEERLSEAGFEKVSIFQPGFLEVEVPRANTRFAEALVGSFVPKINGLFNLHMSVPVVNVGQAMKLATQQPNSIPKNVQTRTSKIGSKVFIFSNKNIDEMTK